LNGVKEDIISSKITTHAADIIKRYYKRRRKTMIVNGKKIILKKEISIMDFLKKESYDTTKVAVEKNGNIVPKKDFEAEMLSDIDKIEIVSFVGGG